MLYNLFYDKISQTLQESDLDSSTAPMELNITIGDDFLRKQMLMRKRGEEDEMVNEK
jgi:hypothetical protein